MRRPKVSILIVTGGRSRVSTTRGGAAAARLAHNQKVAGSSPAPATKLRTPTFMVGFLTWLAARPRLEPDQSRSDQVRWSAVQKRKRVAFSFQTSGKGEAAVLPPLPSKSKAAPSGVAFYLLCYRRVQSPNLRQELRKQFQSRSSGAKEQRAEATSELRSLRLRIANLLSCSARLCC